MLDDLHYKLVVFCCVFSHVGGEGSVLAAACSVIGVGSDIGGSIRMPAFFNGVFGHKPTTGRADVRFLSPPPQKCQEVAAAVLCLSLVGLL